MCRFYSEEAYSFRVRNIAPGALRVLDMQDMHCLRKGAQVPYAVMHQHMHYQCCELLSRVILVKLHHCMQSKAYSSSVHTCYINHIQAICFAAISFH